MKYINGVEVCLFENFRGGRGMKLSFERGGDIDIGFFSYKKYTLVLEKQYKYIHTHTQFIASTDKCNS